jgi:hypothetical protein
MNDRFPPPGWFMGPENLALLDAKFAWGRAHAAGDIQRYLGRPLAEDLAWRNSREVR